MRYDAYGLPAFCLGNKEMQLCTRNLGFKSFLPFHQLRQDVRCYELTQMPLNGQILLTPGIIHWWNMRRSIDPSYAKGWPFEPANFVAPCCQTKLGYNMDAINKPLLSQHPPFSPQLLLTKNTFCWVHIS